MAAAHVSGLEGGNLPADLWSDAPGTVVLENSSSTLKHGKDGELILHPQPSTDPNDPLNWSMKRKLVNFSIASFYVLMVFAMLDIGVVVFQDYNTLLGISYDDLNNTFAANCVGLAFGCLLFVPFSIKYGRRPVYLVTTFVLFICGIWAAVLRDYPNMVGLNVINGLAGAVADTIVQMTVYLAPVVAGYSAVSQGWPWIYWWCTIFLGINFLMFVFFYEETKYATTLVGLNRAASARTTIQRGQSKETEQGIKGSESPPSEQTAVTEIDATIPLKTYRQRLAWTTKTPGSFADFLRHFYQPFLMLTIPGVLYVALQFGAFLSWVSVVAVTESDYFSTTPYNFTTVGIGLLNLPPFIGAIISTLYSGPLSDWSIIRLAKRNGGVYEPEMRLYLTIFPALLGPAGIFLYGFSLAKVSHA
ncbi:hypothetical protein LTR69_000740 [Exophiala sideris]|uniref:Major facilitator superfamily (MFS) profile domain-containing protein n=1 Tax=Exophiala sideris TaxID=1016849 RepID=A0ABR0JRN2_9EURO|nr:hypothetical protein LTR69_000740 [Exophiala sideris]